MKQEFLNKVYTILKDCDYNIISIDRNSIIKLIKDGGCFNHIKEDELSKFNDMLIYDYELVVSEIKLSQDLGDTKAISADVVLKFTKKE